MFSSRSDLGWSDYAMIVEDRNNIALSCKINDLQDRSRKKMLFARKLQDSDRLTLSLRVISTVTRVEVFG